MTKRLSDPYRLAPWITMILAVLTYWATAEQGASLWDCPEYVINAFMLDPGHPPGNPAWMLLHRVATAPFPPDMAARVINMVSGLFMGGGAALLCAVLVTALRLLWRGRTRGTPARWRLALAATGGALTFAWCDSAWFSAVEAEVYAMSLFLTALCVWLMTGWCFMRSGAARTRRLILIAYLTGLSLGVHQLNLLCIPALALIWIFARHPRRSCVAGGWLALAGGCLMVGILLVGFMPAANRWAQVCELWAVNRAGCPFGSGWALAVVSGLAAVFAIPALTRHNAYLRTAGWMTAMFCTGYCVWLLIPIRAAAAPPMNQGDPSDPFAFAAYQGRDQYGSSPLLHGRTPMSRPLVRHENRRLNALAETGVYMRRSAAGYDTAGVRRDYLYPPELDMWFPRMTSTDPADMESYRVWGGMARAAMVPVEVSTAIDTIGGLHGTHMSARPGYMHQLRYFAAYQAGYMYFRYLLWNYLGRQNDIPSTGEADHGNFITGIDLIDDAMLGPQSLLPAEARGDNRGHNLYFGLPLLMGLAGLILLCRLRGRTPRRMAAVTVTLFLLTGLAIVVYLNQSPGEPRERDYSFLGSFWVFSLWTGIALGSMALARRRFIRALGTALSVMVPAMMWLVNYDDHDRSGRRVVETIAADILNQLPPDAVIIVNGDNALFPLWYAQEILGMRRDVTVVAESYLTAPWYVASLGYPGPESDGLPLAATAEALMSRQPFEAVLPDTVTEPMEAAEALRLMFADTAAVRRFPASHLRVQAPDGEREINLFALAGCGPGRRLPLWRVAVWDIIMTGAAADSPRPVFWHLMCGERAYAGLEGLTSPWTLGRRLTWRGDSLPGCGQWHEWLSAMPGDHVDEGAYVDPYSGYMIGTERRGLLRLALSLEEAGRTGEAASLARRILGRVPGTLWPMYPYTEKGHTVFPNVELARLLLSHGDETERQLGDSLLQAETARCAEWSRMVRSYPELERSRLSPRTRNLHAAHARLRRLADSLRTR